jgi:hypothetical protein
MNALINIEEAPVALRPAIDARLWRDGAGSSSLSRQLGIVREMLPTLDTVSAAGQKHIMGKVVAFIQAQAARACRDLSRRNQEMFAELLELLTHESRRLLPDVRIFSHRAESLLAFLGAVA